MIGGNRLPEGLMEEVGSAIRDFELLRAQGFGDSESPLLISVCSGSMSSTPEMMDAILYIGLNDETVRGLSVINGNQRLAYDCYRQLLQKFGRIVCNIDNNYFEWELQTLKKKLRCKTDSELSESALIELCITYKKIIRKMMGIPFPENVYDQLGMAIEAVFRSWKRNFGLWCKNFILDIIEGMDNLRWGKLIWKIVQIYSSGNISSRK
ncbi:hypothetical protein [Paenibacillus alginolyticus]|uniref:Uncharacterized protein n=1 Tax=Paenibacillus alginolyticus TaxID=59839 RepID=A0ABT4GH07_9BACL|nr:hypothetical protein [Paenibacillus alginolyticus]MCY9695436.1 hypothetical protein [Paenibacillus alginolyticus]MEC0146305.1 hypothetical protein [Paenibacillus alginolyticus]